ncbi:Nucleoside diphosphate kinase 1, partial [Conglomerata obtusa]
NFKSFFKSGNVIAMVWSGKNVILEARKIIGSTNPNDAAMGTIRGDLGVDKGRNLVHGSDSEEAAKREIKLWFGDDVDYIKSYDYDLLYEK